MADSLIYLDHLRGNVRITFLLLDLLSTIVQSDAEANSITMRDALSAALRETGVEPDEQTITTIVYRLAEREKRAKERDQHDDMQAAAKAKKKKKMWGDNLNEWALSGDPMEVCMYVADYNSAETRRLYCSEDTEMIFALAKAKYARDFEFARANFEASVYGAGGHFNGDDADTFDMTSGDAGAEAEFAAFFGKGGF